MHLLFLFFIVWSVCFANETDSNTSTKSLKEKKKNIWLKTYYTYKNYNITLTNIAKTEQELRKTKKDSKQQRKLINKLEIYRSKLVLYEKNNSFENILIKYKYETPTISLRDYIFKNSQENLTQLIKKYTALKNEFYLAISTLKVSQKSLRKSDPSNLKLQTLKDDLDFFTEYSESIEQIHQNLLESKADLKLKHKEYEAEIFTKHLLTLLLILITYLLYRFLSYLLIRSTNKKESREDKDQIQKNSLISLRHNAYYPLAGSLYRRFHLHHHLFKCRSRHPYHRH